MINPGFLAPKDPYLHVTGNRLRAWMWAMLNQKAADECRLVFFLEGSASSKWWRFSFEDDSWLSFQLSFCIPRPGLSAFLADDIWQQYGEAYSLSKQELETVKDPIPF